MPWIVTNPIKLPAMDFPVLGCRICPNNDRTVSFQPWEVCWCNFYNTYIRVNRPNCNQLWEESKAEEMVRKRTAKDLGEMTHQKVMAKTFYSRNKVQIKKVISQAGLKYMFDFARGDISRWGYKKDNVKLIFVRVDPIITVQTNDPVMLEVLSEVIPWITDKDSPEDKEEEIDIEKLLGLT